MSKRKQYRPEGEGDWLPPNGHRPYWLLVGPPCKPLVVQPPDDPYGLTMEQPASTDTDA